MHIIFPKTVGNDFFKTFFVIFFSFRAQNELIWRLFSRRAEFGAKFAAALSSGLHETIAFL